LHVAEGEAVIDIGSGPGFLCESIAKIVGMAGRVLGIDISSNLIKRSADRNRYPPGYGRISVARLH
jgi:ubiquinone/menaquinone biosynthesis C-methylase UbiE